MKDAGASAGDRSSSQIRFGKFSLTLISAFSILATPCAMAQQELEEIIVTAERRDQNLQETPIAATVFSAEEIANKGINEIHNIQNFVPNTVVMTYNRSTFINIRGAGLAASAPAANPGVAYYIDGVFVAKEQLVSQTFYDLESMEVLRGPQGTLTGQNSTAGAIYARSTAPSFDSVSGYIDQTIGSYDWYRTIGAVNFPMGDKVALRLAGIYESRGSYTENIGPSPSKPGSGTFSGARAKLAIKPNDSFQINLGVDWFDNDTEYNAIKNPDDLVTSDPFIIEEDAITYLNQKGYRASAEFIYDTSSDIRLRWISSLQRADQEDQADGDRTATAPPIPPGLPANGANRALFPGRVGTATNEFNYVTSEINLFSNSDSPFQWLIGAYYLEENIPLSLLRDNYNTVDFVSSSSDIYTESDATSKALFGQINYKMTDALELVVGLRSSNDEFELTRFALPGPPPPGGFPFTDGTDSTETTGRLGLNYYSSGDTMFYGTISKGYKPGASNLTPGYPSYAPETNLVYEIGAKTMLMDNRVRLNTAIFFSELDDFQLLSLLAVGGGPPLPTFQNGTKGESKGIEVELAYANEALSYNLAVGYLDGTFAEDDFLNNSATGGDELVTAGTPLPFSPEWTISGGIQYDFNFGNTVFTPRFQAAYVDQQFTTPFSNARSILPSYTIADVKFIFNTGEKWRFEAFINNVFDETYIAAQVQDASSTDGGYIYGAPLVYGGRVSYSFE